MPRELAKFAGLQKDGRIVGTNCVVESVRPYVSETIWIGKMNKARTRVDMGVAENVRMVERIEELQSDANILRLYETRKNDERVRWKDSIKCIN